VTHDQVEAMTMGSRICVLSAGKLMQIDTPYNLYHNPSNVFVAGFIGSPSMNFFDAMLKPNGEALVLDTGVFQLTIPPTKATPYKNHVGQEVILGVRPEDIHDLEFVPPGITPSRLEANVEVVEQMGNEMIVYLEENGKSFIARTDPRTNARVGARLPIAISLDNIHVFDRKTELSLAYDFKREEIAKAVR